MKSKTILGSSGIILAVIILITAFIYIYMPHEGEVRTAKQSILQPSCNIDHACWIYLNGQFIHPPISEEKGCYNGIFFEVTCDSVSPQCSESTCASGQCDGTTKCKTQCTSKSYTDCYNNDVYWFDSCKNRETKIEECDYGCANGDCKSADCESQDYYKCVNGHVYWFDSCDKKESKKETCSNGCTDDECDIADPECKPEFISQCSDGDVYYFDSCDTKGDLKEDCELGCANGECKIIDDEEPECIKSSDCEEGSSCEEGVCVAPAPIENIVAWVVGGLAVLGVAIFGFTQKKKK